MGSRDARRKLNSLNFDILFAGIGGVPELPPEIASRLPDSSRRRHLPTWKRESTNASSVPPARVHIFKRPGEAGRAMTAGAATGTGGALLAPSTDSGAIVLRSAGRPPSWVPPTPKGESPIEGAPTEDKPTEDHSDQAHFGTANESASEVDQPGDALPDIDQPEDEQPVAEQPEVDQPVAEQPEDEQPGAETETQPEAEPAMAPAAIGAITLDDGTRYDVETKTTIGRDPLGALGEVIRLDDPKKTMSKTHLQVRAAEGGITLIDLKSTNGTYLESPAGISVRTRPNHPVFVEFGSTVRFGSRSFTVTT